MPRRKPSIEVDYALALRIRELRHGAGMTQQDLAVAAGYHASAVYWLERDGRGSVDLMRAVAKALECDIGDLLR